MFVLNKIDVEDFNYNKNKYNDIITPEIIYQLIMNYKLEIILSLLYEEILIISLAL